MFWLNLLIYIFAVFFVMFNCQFDKYKNGKAYPWSSDISTLILYPQSENQTIYTRSTKLTDAGNYTCVLRNNSHVTEHRTELIIKDTIPDRPLVLYKAPDLSVDIGETARLFCEAYVGVVNLPDVKGTVEWYQIFDDRMENIEKHLQTHVERESGIVGSYLIIPNVQVHNYGRYLCRIEIGNESHRLDLITSINSKPLPGLGYPYFAPMLCAIVVISLLFGCAIILKIAKKRRIPADFTKEKLRQV